MIDSNRALLENVEKTIVQLLNSLITQRIGLIKVPNIKCCKFQNNCLTSENSEMTNFRQISYNKAGSRHRFCLVIYMLNEVHHLLKFGGSCTVRGLYYRDTQLIRAQYFISAARLDVCRMLNTAPALLGILSASKGLIAGDIQMLMSNGDIVDCNCYNGATSLPADFERVERIVTQAELVLVVEKESVFETLLSCNLFGTLSSKSILITGKGYPDCSTRRIVHRLAVECKLPTYILVDADPFGIEIMLVYRHGSKAMGFTSNCLNAPMLRWIGLHPSEICKFSQSAAPLSVADNKKICNILARNDISLGVRQELCFLKRLQFKAEIESVLEFLSQDYIPNKIKRHLFL